MHSIFFGFMEKILRIQMRMALILRRRRQTATPAPAQCLLDLFALLIHHTALPRSIINLWIDHFHLRLPFHSFSCGLCRTFSWTATEQNASKQNNDKSDSRVLCRKNKISESRYSHTHTHTVVPQIFTCTKFFLRYKFCFVPSPLRDEILCILCLISGGLMGFFWDSFVITGPISLLCRRESENDDEKKQQMQQADPILDLHENLYRLLDFNLF